MKNDRKEARIGYNFRRETKSGSFFKKRIYAKNVVFSAKICIFIQILVKNLIFFKRYNIKLTILLTNGEESGIILITYN